MFHRVKCLGTVHGKESHCFAVIIIQEFAAVFHFYSLMVFFKVFAAVSHFYSLINPAIDIFFPVKKIKVSSNDPVLVSPLVMRKRNGFIKKGMLDEANALQPRIGHLVLENQVSAIKSTNGRFRCSSRKWWKTVDQITGRASKEIPLFDIFNLDDLNEHFQHINTDCHYESPTTMTITDDTYVRIIDENTTLIFLSTVKRTAVGPDGIGHWFWRDFALELAPTITYLFNLSIKSQVVPLQWKSANITPNPKESPVSRMEQLRPISVTDIIIRLFERIIYTKELKSIVESAISYNQFAYRRGRNTTMSLLLCQHLWMKWLNSQADSVRVFAFDFLKLLISLVNCLLTLIFTTG
ncbi:LINE-1 reverse transcriptase-like protein [Acropora cervicornis]|uniref:LINE-1 reverse transcriptase-like protein n=1 Tax=Acropora cervicornis TaxID=6130 RepID=A0AAD9V1M0_ACRCE|nr:LINE-1 reverse transcriptase-like protein [Acropora cervicornis]